MRLSQACFALVAAVALSACGKDDDGDSVAADEFFAVYQTTAHTENETGCDAEGPAATETDAYFKLAAASEVFPLSPEGAMAYLVCASADDCSGNHLNGKFYFPGKVDGAWQGQSTAYSSGGGTVTCSMGATDAKAVLAEDGTLTMEARSYVSGPLTGVSEEDCDYKSELFREKRPSFTCARFEVIRAKKL